VLPLIKLPETRYKGKHGPTHAAIMIQKVYRGHRMRKRYKLLQKQQESAFKIQKQWKLRLQFLSTLKSIKDSLAKAETSWRKVMDDFKRDWKKIKKMQRYKIIKKNINSI
jgi:flagellar biosynthesis chaperone FliJ